MSGAAVAAAFGIKGAQVPRLGQNLLHHPATKSQHQHRTPCLKEPPSVARMKITSITALFTLVLSAVAMPEHTAERDAGLEASKFTLCQSSEDARPED